MPTFIHLCDVRELPDAGVAGFTPVVDGQPVPMVALQRNGVVQVFHDICPHAGRSLALAPGRFLVDAGLLVCAAHGASFSLPEGHCVSGPCRGQSLVAVPFELRDGGVWVDPA